MNNDDKRKLIGLEYTRTIVELGGRKFTAESHLIGVKVGAIHKDGTLLMSNGIPLKLIKELS